jgi:hypothetical protein
MSVTFTASTLGPTASSFTLTSSSGVTGTGASSPLTLQETVIGTYTYTVSGTNANGTGPSSAASNSVVVANVFAPSGAYDSIATATASGAPSTLSFTSIPQTYTHLQLRIIGGNNGYACDMTFNSDTGANYASHRLTANNGLEVTSGSRTSFNAIRFAQWSGLNYSGSTVSATVMDILDYKNTNKYKTSRDFTGYDTNSAGYLDFESGLWMSTAAITRIDLTMQIGTWATGSTVALYGIKGS